MQYLKKAIYLGISMVFIIGLGSGCAVQKNDFAKKKYKISKNKPPAQRYYSKGSIFTPRR
jgi:hypothetical protein